MTAAHVAGLVGRRHASRGLAPAAVAVACGRRLTNALLAAIDRLADAGPDHLRHVRLRDELTAREKLLEGEAHALGGRITKDRLRGKCTHHDPLELLRILPHKRGGRRELALQNGVHHLVIAVSAERTLSGGGLVEHAPQREDVAPPIDGGTGHLLRRHVRDLTLELTSARGFVELPERLGDAEVRDLRGAVGGEQDVVRGEVAMNDAERASVVVGQLVSGVQTRARVGNDARDDPRVDRLGLAARAEHARERIAVDPLHDQVERVLLLAELVDLADVWMVYAGRDARLVEEHPLELRLLGEVREDGLDGDELLEPALPVQTRRPHAGHAATGDGNEQLVATEARAREHRAVVRRLLDQLVGRQDLGHRGQGYTKATARARDRQASDASSARVLDTCFRRQRERCERCGGPPAGPQKLTVCAPCKGPKRRRPARRRRRPVAAAGVWRSLRRSG